MSKGITSIILLTLLSAVLMACGSQIPIPNEGAPTENADPSSTTAPSESVSPVTEADSPTKSAALEEEVAEEVIKAPTATVESTETAQGEIDNSSSGGLTPLSRQQFPSARSIDFTVTENNQVYVAFGRDSDIYVTRSTDGGTTFGEEVVASQDGGVFVFPLERPAIILDTRGRLHVAWPEDNFPGRIWNAFSDDDGVTFSPPAPLSTVGPETVLVRLALNPAGAPVAAWLQNSGLSFAQSAEGGKSFQPEQVVDDQTCDCCHPQPVWLNDELLIAYRNLVFDDDNRQIRDIYLVKSADGGATFGEPLRISDAPWYIAACPFSGPSLVTDGDQMVYAAWMDGRNDERGNLSQTDIWLSTSNDGGQTFSPNRRINQSTGVYNNLPSLARDDTGRLHVIWESRETDRSVLYYSWSVDDGLTFAPPQVLVDSTQNDGRRPSNASLFVGPSEKIVVSWVDNAGGYLGIWEVNS